MNPDRVKDVFLRALQESPDSRASFVEQELGTNGTREEVDEVLSLLKFHDKSASFLAAGALADAGIDAMPQTETMTVGSRVGPFVLEAPIGRGGMGIVYRARQESPPRPVAIKIVLSGSAGPSLSRRFAREAAFLARLHHPNIAQVYSAGVDKLDGRSVPYLAMELVEGKPLDHYIRAQNPSIRERAELLALVCEGVAHAHQRGVVHRDLKPANILIERSGQPKILDFGIARLIESADTDGSVTPVPTQHTRRGEILGTLAYMSPEQFEGDPDRIDVRADVYALGVIMYESLAGRPAINTEKLSIAQAAMAVSTREPDPLGSIDSSLRGDLETIAAKALEKDPARRYQSAAEMSEDLRRYLRDEPILARPATAFYRTAKFVRRNRAVVALAVAVFSLLLAGMAGTLWQSSRIKEASEHAEREKRAANEANLFLQDMLLSTEPHRARGQVVTMRMALDEAAARLDRGAIKSDRVRASLHGVFGRAYWAMGAMEIGERHSRRAISLRQELYGKESIEYLNGVCDLSVLLHDVGRDEEAAAIAGPALETARGLSGDHRELIARLINSYANSVRFDAIKSKRLYDEAYAMYRELEGDDGELTLMTMNNISAWYMDQGNIAEAERMTRDVLARRTRLHGEDHPDVIVSLKNLGACLRAQDRLPEAIEVMKKCVEIGDRVRGVSHPSQLNARLEYAVCLGLAGDPAESERMLMVGIPLTLDSTGKPTANTATYYGVLGEVLVLLDRSDEALRAAQSSLDAAVAVFGDGHEETKRAASVFVSAYEGLGNWSAARTWNEKTRNTPWFQERYILRPGQNSTSPPFDENTPQSPSPAIQPEGPGGG
jgi:tetratricopeptide (TPR) repeat protein